jgi:uncharacterized delta-60 repeat protein
LTSREARRSWARAHPGLALLAATVFAFTLHGSQTDAAPGDLDPNFSRNGKLTIDFGAPRAEGALEVAELASGKILVVGGFYTDEGSAILIARLKRDSSLDRSFSRDGKEVVNPAGRQDWNAASISSDGSVVVVGESTFSRDFVLARIRPNGRLDRSFSADGVVELDFSGSDDVAFAVAQQPDGKVVVAGSGGPDGFAIARLERDGSLDPTFSEDGTATPAFPLGVHALALLPDGEIVAVGAATNPDFGLDLGVARLLPEGSPDPSFGDDGTHQFDFGRIETGQSVAVQADGRIVVGGRSFSGAVIGPGANIPSPLLVRLEPNGDLDQSFPVLTALPVSEVTDLAAQPGGILGVGPPVDPISKLGDFVLFGRRADGSKDRSFPRSDGSARTDFHQGEDHSVALAEQAPGRLLVAGDVTQKVQKRLLELAKRIHKRARKFSRKKRERLRDKAFRIGQKAIERGPAIGVGRYVMPRGGRDRR